MFNINKYQKCLNRLISFKTVVLFLFTFVFAVIGVLIGLLLLRIFHSESAVVISAIVSGILGLFFGLNSLWRVEMRIQEAYWRMEIYNDFKKLTGQK